MNVKRVTRRTLSPDPRRATGNQGKQERERERKSGKGRQVQYWYNIACPEMAAADSDDPRGSHY